MEKKFFSFLFDIILYYGISKETIRKPFRGLTMLKSPKLTIKGGLCYGFAMVKKKVSESDWNQRHTVYVTQIHYYTWF